MQNRKERWKKFRHLISQRAKTCFTLMLSARQFRGKLFTNHERRELDMTVRKRAYLIFWSYRGQYNLLSIFQEFALRKNQVEPDITKSNARGRQTKTLSGGEKSFATICLLLSLWDAMGSPIRCLDEL